MKFVEIFTDGACHKDKVGGWGVLLRYKGMEKSMCGGEKETTNNRMEMMAVIKGLQALTEPCIVHVTTDSQYVLKGITEWIHGWKKKGWKTAGWGNKKKQQDVKNKDLWLELDEATKGHQITWEWVRGHDGHRENEIADQLANEGLESVL